LYDDLNNPLKKYDIIFYCGFYGFETWPFNSIVKQTKNSGVKFVVFQAENEQPFDGALAWKLNENVDYVGWYDILRYLTDESILSKNDLQEKPPTNDHTSTRGGLAGAMACYAYIYGEMPKIPESPDAGNGKIITGHDDNSANAGKYTAQQEKEMADRIAAVVKGFVLDKTIKYCME
jgi:hypothetical protein